MTKPGSKKVQKRFVDHGCGFPVTLQNVPMVFARGTWTPDIDYNELHRLVARGLARKATRLTGAQIRFIRQYFNLTLVEFGDFFDVTHPAVLKWEAAEDDVPAIKWSLERDIRLFILDRLGENFESVGQLYRQLRVAPKKPARQSLPVSLRKVG